MAVHFIHDLGQDPLVEPYAPAEAVCGALLREAHEVVAPGSEAEVCPACLSWSKRNKFQNRRAAVEMAGAAAASPPAEAGA
jgi:ribosome-binding protein aMBF1 (putative translation factor)